MRTMIVVMSVSLLLAGGALAAQASGPTLTLVGNGRSAVKGQHFRPHAAVRIVFTSATQQVRVVRAGATGSFTAPLAQHYSVCDGLTVTATDGSGNTAVLKLPRIPRGCLPAGSTG